jgi:hypothetical protein
MAVEGEKTNNNRRHSFSPSLFTPFFLSTWDGTPRAQYALKSTANHLFHISRLF